MAKFSLTIGPPHAGWINITVRPSSGDELTLRTSYLSDAPGDLANAAAEIARLRGRLPEPIRFTWQDEPGAWEWMIETAGDALCIRILEYSIAFPHRTAPSREIAAFEVPAIRFCRCVLSAFHAVIQSIGEVQYHAKWRYAVPMGTLAKLQRCIAEWNEPPG
ncbi:MAG: hypothetical protein KF859_10050 [Phycisphaeraceae bacterium]|nr:hypothetical protein [Phycisphaeraceae bacterium]